MLGVGGTFVQWIRRMHNIHLMNLRTFDLNLLRALEALISESSVSSAAKRLHLSQPATSSSLGRLRDALGDPLLIRQGGRMVRTPVAERLLPSVQRVLAQIESTLSDRGAFEAISSARTFRIGVSDFAAAILLPTLQKRLQHLAPSICLDAVPLDDRLEDRLNALELDLALGDRDSLGAAERIETLFEEAYLCVARSEHPRLPKRPKLKDYLTERHIAVAPRGRTPDAVEAALSMISERRRVATVVPHFLVAPMIVSQTDLVLTIARHVALYASQTMGVRTFAPPFAIPSFPVVMAWTNWQASDEARSWLREQIRKAVRGDPV